MSTFAELQCFNKLLLEKMKRMEQKHKEEMQKLYYTYDSLREETIMVGEGCDVEDIHYCEECELWFNSKYDKNCVGDYGTDWCCGDCVDKGLCTLYKCDNCCGIFEGDENKEEYFRKFKGHYDNEDCVCEKCYKGYIIYDADNGIDDGEVIDKMVSKKYILLKELLKKFKN